MFSESGAKVRACLLYTSVGATPSVVRAAIMTSSALFASLTDRKQDSYNAMGLAAILLLGIRCV